MNAVTFEEIKGFSDGLFDITSHFAKQSKSYITTLDKKSQKRKEWVKIPNNFYRWDEKTKKLVKHLQPTPI